MVRRGLGALLGFLMLAPGGHAADLSVTAATLSSTAETAMEPLPGRPAEVPYVPNQPVEDFFAVTLISLPFTAFWGLIGALVVGGIAQNQFPPDFDTPLLAGAGSAAVAASIATGLVSVQWGGSKLTPTPTPVVTSQP